MAIQDVVIIGSGNVATCMGLAFKQAGIHISAVYSPTVTHASELAQKLDAECYNTLADLPQHADLYLLAVKDEVIGQVSSQLTVNGLVVHTSGSTPDHILQQKRRGVFYALQTFKKHAVVDFAEVPFLIEANSAADELSLLELAQKLSGNVRVASTSQRQALHVAAVFANNFTTHLAGIASHLLAQHHLPYDLLKPLILQTALSVTQYQPEDVQTGPAIRGDERTLAIHEELLKSNNDWLTLYKLLTKSIQEADNKKKV